MGLLWMRVHQAHERCNVMMVPRKPLLRRIIIREPIGEYDSEDVISFLETLRP